MKHTESQTKQIAEYLIQGNRLTPLEALNLFGCLRLSGRIFDLREQGMNIKTDIITVNNKNIAQYSLCKSE